MPAAMPAMMAISRRRELADSLAGWRGRGDVIALFAGHVATYYGAAVAFAIDGVNEAAGRHGLVADFMLMMLSFRS